MTPLDLAQRLISIDSVTTHPNLEVTKALADVLEQIGFTVSRQEYTDLQGMQKLMLAGVRRPDGPDAGLPPIGYFCHTDVVPVEGWNCVHGGPFDAKIAEDRLWGRGACDMKGSIAAAVSALSCIDSKQQRVPIYFFATGDEECGMRGAEVLAANDPLYAELADRSGIGIIGEPTLLRAVNAHKGGCRIDVVAHGVAAHSSTHEGRNANWDLVPFLQDLAEIRATSMQDPSWQNPAFSPPDITLNLVIDNQPAASNITVAVARCQLFFRPMPNSQVGLKEVKDLIMAAATRHGLEAREKRDLLPLFTLPGRASLQAILKITGQSEPQAVSYATDGSFFPQLEDRIVIGPGSIEQAHRGDEWISLDQLSRGSSLFEQIFRHFACSPPARQA